eukprot:6201742-Pleurochrysis_carterae.AAC.1
MPAVHAQSQPSLSSAGLLKKSCFSARSAAWTTWGTGQTGARARFWPRGPASTAPEQGGGRGCSLGGRDGVRLVEFLLGGGYGVQKRKVFKASEREGREVAGSRGHVGC